MSISPPSAEQLLLHQDSGSTDTAASLSMSPSGRGAAGGGKSVTMGKKGKSKK
jgi:hypothetical protein